MEKWDCTAGSMWGTGGEEVSKGGVLFLFLGRRKNNGANEGVPSSAPLLSGQEESTAVRTGYKYRKRPTSSGATGEVWALDAETFGNGRRGASNCLFPINYSPDLEISFEHTLIPSS